MFYCIILVHYLFVSTLAQQLGGLFNFSQFNRRPDTFSSVTSLLAPGGFDPVQRLCREDAVNDLINGLDIVSDIIEQQQLKSLGCFERYTAVTSSDSEPEAVAHLRDEIAYQTKLCGCTGDYDYSCSCTYYPNQQTVSCSPGGAKRDTANIKEPSSSRSGNSVISSILGAGGGGSSPFANILGIGDQIAQPRRKRQVNLRQLLFLGRLASFIPGLNGKPIGEAVENGVNGIDSLSLRDLAPYHREVVMHCDAMLDDILCRQVTNTFRHKRCDLCEFVQLGLVAGEVRVCTCNAIREWRPVDGKDFEDQLIYKFLHDCKRDIDVTTYIRRDFSLLLRNNRLPDFLEQCRAETSSFGSSFSPFSAQ